MIKVAQLHRADDGTEDNLQNILNRRTRGKQRWGKQRWGKRWRRNTYDYWCWDTDSYQQTQERQSKWQQWHQSRRHQDLSRCNERNDRTGLQRSVKAKKSCTPEPLRRIRMKSYPQKKETKNMSETITNLFFASAMQAVLDRVLYSRLYLRLDQRQPEDQGGFRHSYQTLDHLATYWMIEQKAKSGCVNMVRSTIDFMKAFDFISPLKTCGIEQNKTTSFSWRGLFKKKKKLIDKGSDVLFNSTWLSSSGRRVPALECWCVSARADVLAHWCQNGIFGWWEGFFLSFALLTASTATFCPAIWRSRVVVASDITQADWPSRVDEMSLSMYERISVSSESRVNALE